MNFSKLDTNFKVIICPVKFDKLFAVIDSNIFSTAQKMFNCLVIELSHDIEAELIGRLQFAEAFDYFHNLNALYNGVLVKILIDKKIEIN